MKGIILLNGIPPKRIEMNEGDIIVCADGAYDWSKKLGIIPNIILGDFDSIQSKPSNIENIQYPSEKNYTDGEICLNYLIDKQITTIHLWGGFGGRTDHLLGNLSLLKFAHENNVNAILRSDNENILLCSGKVKLNTFKNIILSIVPFSDSVHIMESQGLQYPLNDLIIKNNSTRGISNLTTADVVELNIVNGLALIYVEKWRD